MNSINSLRPQTASGSLDLIRLVETPASTALCRSKFSRIFQAVDILSGTITDINCKSWRCPRHKEKWYKKWGTIIKSQLEYTPCTLLLNLTTSEFVDWQVIEKALRRFMLKWRQFAGPTEYVKVVEYNRKQTQPHFHLLLYSPKMKIPPMPPDYPKDRSWPDHIFRVAQFIWLNALRYAAPFAKDTTVVWCQPPKSGAAAAQYAVGYITQKGKQDEEPNETWRGRRITFSKNFFWNTPRILWAEKLREWFGPPTETYYFWQPKEHIPDADLPALQMFANMPIMVQRYKEAVYYQRNGKLPFPVPDSHRRPALGEYMLPSGQTSLEIIELASWST